MSTGRTAQDINLKPRTGDVLIEENLDFRGLLLTDQIQEGLSKCGFQRPSPIQLKAIPLGRCGLDLIVQAKSGTGKTCVFAVIALDGLLLDSMATQVLVLAPTREIAIQICEVINSIGSCMPGLKCLTFIGGTPLSEDRQKLSRCHIAVGTPGRVKQLIEENILPTGNIRLFVLDEADKLLEDSFQDQVNWIFSSLPENKQMLALSATYPEVLAQHLTAYMRNPTFLRLNVTDPALLGIRQYYKKVAFHPLANKLFDSKTEALLELLSSVEFHQCLVFSNYQMRAESLSELLNFRGWPATYISGSREQQDRVAALTSLKQMTCRVLISTDLTSRGIDAENVNLVVNLDLPPNHETYLHRIGRAGRFGTYGAGVSFVAEGKEMEELRRLEKACNTDVKPLPDPIPVDLARSSGFVNIDHLVTSEVLLTQIAGVKTHSPLKRVVPAKPEVTPEVKPKVIPEIKPKATPEVKPKVITEVKPKVTPEVTPEVKSKVTPEVTPEVKPKVKDIGPVVKETEATDSSVKPVADQRISESDKVSIDQKSKLEGEITNGPDTPKVEKSKRKTNNIWTNLSFSYGAECKMMEEQKKKGQQVNAGPGDQRRNLPRTSSVNAAGKVKVTDAENKENQVSNGEDRRPTSVVLNGATESINLPGLNSVGASVSRKTVLTIPSQLRMRGPSVKPRPFSEINADYEKCMEDASGALSETQGEESGGEQSLTEYVEYLENVAKLLKEISKTEDGQAAPGGKSSLEQKVAAVKQRPQKVVQAESAAQVESASKSSAVTETGTKSSPCAQEYEGGNAPTKKCSLSEGRSKSSAESGENSAIKGECVKSSARGGGYEKSSTHIGEGIKSSAGGCEKSSSPKGKTGKSSAPTVECVKDNKATGERQNKEKSPQKETIKKNVGGGRKKCPTELSSLDMMTNYQALEVNDGVDPCSEAVLLKGEYEHGEEPTAHKTKSNKQSKRNRRVDPYGPWEPYVPPEVPVSSYEDGKNLLTDEIEDDDDDDDDYEESESESESEWESSSLRCTDSEASEGAASISNHHRKQSFANPHFAGNAYQPPPFWGTPPPLDEAYYNMMMAQQSMMYTNFCYQQYMMHQQYAEYYKKLLKIQQKPWDMQDLYASHQKYIRKMSKWMAKNYPS